MTVFEYRNYKEFLNAWLGRKDAEKGIRGKLAAHLRCQPSFLSQVLNGKPELSLEQAYRACGYFGFGADETEFFLTLVQQAKASDPALIRYFQSQIEARLLSRAKIASRVGAEVTLSFVDQTRYYSSWIYSAVHIVAALSETNRRASISKHLRIAKTRIDATVDFLVRAGILNESPEGVLTLGQVRMHLPVGSVMLPKHHENWRTRAVEAMESPQENDLHYSLVMGLSAADVLKVRDLVLELVSKTETILRDSPEAKGCVLLADFFEI